MPAARPRRSASPAARAAASLALAACLGFPGAARAQAVDHVVPTAVAGKSWLNRLGISRAATAMGQMGEAGARSGEGRPSHDEGLDRPFTLTGEDLFRLDCRACHNTQGTGAPPEIRSLLDAVKATSPTAIRAQMTARGMAMDAATARQMAGQGEAALRERLRKGGEKMPPFPHLEAAEVDALLGYLRHLAGVPDGRPPLVVTETGMRVGEHVVKATCTICHDATGPGRDAMAASPGLIPSLSSFLDQEPVNVVVRKVREGAPAPGTMSRRGEMPVFAYLSAPEIAAAYVYLLAYPPRP